MSELIEKQAAIDALDNYCNEKCKIRDYNWCPDCQYENFKKVLITLPSAQPEREKGEWVYNSPVTMKCNRCGLVIKDCDWHRFKICPNCGADMKGGEQE